MSKPEDLAAAKHSTNRAVVISASANAASEVTCAARVSGRSDIAPCAKLNRFSSQPNDEGYLMEQEQHQSQEDVLDVPDWRAHSAQFARGEKCPETIETLQAAWARDQELVFDQKAEIGRLKATVNDLRQKLAAHPVRQLDIPAGYALVPIEPTMGMYVAANKADDAAFVGGSAHGATVEDVWYAMVDAAPQPTEG